MATKNKKGYAFEFFVKQLLLRNGFTPITSDNKLIYDTGIGQMIHGLGQPHNADVLVSPPFQTPFYFPTRLLVECKCYEKELGISFARNVLGLREDVNHFDIVTPEILNKRRNYKRTAPAVYNFDRYTYQAALASLTGFKKTAQEFALVHRIPLISFASSLFERIKDLVMSFDNILMEAQIDREQVKRIIHFFHSNRIEHKPYRDDYVHFNSKPILYHWFIEFHNEINRIAENMDIGIIDNGNLLFMYRDYEQHRASYQFNDGYTLHWQSTHNYWSLVNSDNEFTYHFELPQDIMREWALFSNNRRTALDIKERYFSTILVYQMAQNLYPEIKILRLSQDFLRHAIDNLN